MSNILTDAVSTIDNADVLRKDTAKADDFVEEVDKASDILNNLDGVI